MSSTNPPQRAERPRQHPRSRHAGVEPPEDHRSTKFDRLTDEDVHAVDGRYDEFSQRLSHSYGYDQQRVDDEISRFVSEGGNSAAATAAAEDARNGDHRGMGARVGRDGRSDPGVGREPAAAQPRR